MREIRQFCLLLSCVACAGTQASTSPANGRLEGRWRGVLSSPGGELPFGIEISDGAAVIINGEERVPTSGITREGTQVVIGFDWYQSTLTATLSADGQALVGTWQKVIPGGESRLPFRATRADATVRFRDGRSATSTVAHHYRVTFDDDNGPYVARGAFEQRGAAVRGTFLTTTGDYRFLEGAVHGDELLLSCFDGAHAFLFRAKIDEQQGLQGDFWSRDSYHAKWNAQPVARAQDATLPDPYGLTKLTNDERRFGFSFEDLEGRIVSSTDPAFHNQVVVVEIFGSWCPNCNDQAPTLARWDREYRDRGLRVVGLAFEFDSDPEKVRAVLTRYGKRHGIEYPILVAGPSAKRRASEALADLSEVHAYPTTLFIDRSGRVRKIHTGFAGPGTGAVYERLVAEQEALIQTLLGETSDNAR